jgi:SHS2 domain-containing protein
VFFVIKNFMEKKFEVIEHTADVGITVYGKTITELFENAAVGMYNIICQNFDKISETYKYNSCITEVDIESCLVSFLNDLIYQTFVNKLLFCKFLVTDLRTEQNSCILSYQCFGEKYDQQKHGVLSELKSATFHQLKIVKQNNVYTTTIIFDT